MMIIEKKVHSNVIIRKNLKTKAKMGKLITEIFDETIAGTYPVYFSSNGQYPENFTARLKRLSIHPDTWKKMFGTLMYRDGLRTHLRLKKEEITLIQNFYTTVYPVIQEYKKLGKVERRILECLFIHSLKNG